MSSQGLVSRWVAPHQLPSSKNVRLPHLRSLRNTGRPAYFLRPATDELREKGDYYDERELGEGCTSVGHIYFHPDTRDLPTIPPFAELEAFAAANPELPIVVDSERADPCEWPHIVLARLTMNEEGEVGVDSEDTPLVILYTIAADNRSRAFDPATHVKGGEQKEGVNILDWGMVTFDKHYRHSSLLETYRLIYRDLCSLIK